MGVYNGQLPKDEDSRIRRNAPLYERIPLQWDGELRGKPLPKTRDWLPITKKWWSMWRRSAQAMVFVETDWSYMYDTAVLYDRMHQPNCPNTAFNSLSESVRKRLSMYGDNYGDRRKMNIDIITSDTITRSPEALDEEFQELIDYEALLGDDVTEGVES